jgi:hypothetical protein
MRLFGIFKIFAVKLYTGLYTALFYRFADTIDHSIPASLRANTGVYGQSLTSTLNPGTAKDRNIEIYRLMAYLTFINFYFRHADIIGNY